jgi:hypothetical protein
MLVCGKARVPCTGLWCLFLVSETDSCRVVGEIWEDGVWRIELL